VLVVDDGSVCVVHGLLRLWYVDVRCCMGLWVWC